MWIRCGDTVAIPYFVELPCHHRCFCQTRAAGAKQLRAPCSVVLVGAPFVFFQLRFPCIGRDRPALGALGSRTQERRWTVLYHGPRTERHYSMRSPNRIETLRKRSNVEIATSGMYQRSPVPCVPSSLPVDKEGLAQPLRYPLVRTRGADGGGEGCPGGAHVSRMIRLFSPSLI